MFKTIIERDGAFYLVSTIKPNGPWNEWETLVFPCTREGEVTNWGELDGYRYENQQEATAGHKRFVETFRP